MMSKVTNELQELFVKIIVPALITISAMLAIENKRKKVSRSVVFCSIVVGVGIPYLCSTLIFEHISNEFIPVIVAVIALSSEKIMSWFMYKMNLDVLGDAFIEMLKNWIIRRGNK